MPYAAPHTIIGTACYSGLAGTFVTTVHLAAETSLQGLSHARTAAEWVLEDGGGNPIAEGFGRAQDSLDIEFTPVAASHTLAATEVQLPAVGTQVTLADTGIASIDGAWNYRNNARIILQAKGPAKISMTVTRKGPLNVNGLPTVMALVV